jgi:two-component system LytT family response regulator
MIKAIIIEDEAPAANLLESLVAHTGKDVTILEKCHDLPDGVRSIRTHKPDLVFLDIELPVYSGTDLLQFFNPDEINFQIIFTTAYQDYAVRAFEMSAVDYLLKPIHLEKLQLAIEKAEKRLCRQTHRQLTVLESNMKPEGRTKIVVPVATGYEVLNLGDILFFQAEGSYTEIHYIQAKPIMASKNLKHFEFILEGHPAFIRIHRSYLVNARHIQRILRKDGGVMAVIHKQEFPVSDEKVNTLIEVLKSL